MYRVMLVEDDEAIRYVYSKMKSWGKYGFRIECEAQNGIQAIEMMKQKEIDIIFTDIRMPFMDGITMMKEMRKDNPEQKFVLVSSYNEFEYAREGLRLGALDYIVKPVGEKELEPVLERAAQLLGEQKKNRSGELLENVVVEKDCMNDALILNIVRFLEEHIKENLAIDDVAEAMNMNKDYLGKQIKLKTGIPFRSLYNGVKIEYAKPLIKSGQYKVYEISELLGYSSPDYFTQLFKNVVGMTPAEYRKQTITSDF